MGLEVAWPFPNPSLGFYFYLLLPSFSFIFFFSFSFLLLLEVTKNKSQFLLLLTPKPPLPRDPQCAVAFIPRQSILSFLQIKPNPTLFPPGLKKEMSPNPLFFNLFFFLNYFF